MHTVLLAIVLWLVLGFVAALIETAYMWWRWQLSPLDDLAETALFSALLILGGGISLAAVITTILGERD